MSRNHSINQFKKSSKTENFVISKENKLQKKTFSNDEFINNYKFQENLKRSDYLKELFSNDFLEEQSNHINNIRKFYFITLGLCPR